MEAEAGEDLPCSYAAMGQRDVTTPFDRWSGSVRTNTRLLVLMLLRGDYDGLEIVTEGRCMSRDEIAQAVQLTEDRLVRPPDRAFRQMPVVEIPNCPVPTFSAVFPLWTQREGRSDLLITLRMYEAYGGQGLKKEILAIERTFRTQA